MVIPLEKRICIIKNRKCWNGISIPIFLKLKIYKNQKIKWVVDPPQWVVATQKHAHGHPQRASSWPSGDGTATTSKNRGGYKKKKKKKIKKSNGWPATHSMH
jgi:hypothetical protein